MNRKLGRLLEPGMDLFFMVMLIFSAASMIAGAGALALTELVITGVLYGYYQYSKLKRRRELEAFIQSATNTLGNTDGGKTPFPMALVRMGDGAMIWANEGFMDLSGFRDKMHSQKITDLMPEFKMDWLVSGKREYPTDVGVNGRRYRIFGSTIHADDPYGTMLAALYFTDLTDLYQIRDEYIRSRPVVSIILIDNYEELTKNLTESATSNLNASLNEAITAWAEDYHGLLRRMERNRYLLIFEKRDLIRATEDKYRLLRLTAKCKEVLEDRERVVVSCIETKEEEIEITSPAKSKQRMSDLLTSSGFELFETLRILRYEIAKEEAMPPYIIFSDKTLVDMCVKTPTTRTDMMQVSGVGENKYERYGERFLSCIFPGSMRRASTRLERSLKLECPYYTVPAEQNQ